MNPPEKKMKLPFIEPFSSDDRAFFVQEEVVFREACERWNEYLVGYFISGNPTFKVVPSAAKSVWGKIGLEEVLADNSGFYFFKLPGAQVRSKKEGLGCFLEKPSSCNNGLRSISFARLSIARSPCGLSFTRSPYLFGRVGVQMV
ncbi:hypothetical protein Drorol1_Dr00005310 [Drosera rotundifolia]